MAHHKLQPNGFALLMSMIVVSVVISVGLTLLDLSLKQLRLSTNSRDSEIAFHAANAGLECGRFWRVAESVKMEAGNSITPTCFGGVSAGTVNTASPGPIASNGGSAYLYSYQFSWGPTGAERCSSISVLTINSAAGATSTVSGMEGLLSGYPNSTKDCTPAGRCTVFSIRGYNRTCGNITLPGTLQREVLLEL